MCILRKKSPENKYWAEVNDMQAEVFRGVYVIPTAYFKIH